MQMNSQKPVVSHTQRLFLALWPDGPARHQLSLHARAWTWPPDCIQYLPDDWHVTLHFIGEVPSARVADIAANVALPFQAFEWVLDQPRLWPHGLAVLCANKVPAALQDLHDRLGDALCGLGLPVETRPYCPHVTLARRADTAVLPVVPPSVVWQISRYALVVSTGKRDGHYRTIREYQ
jgi:2'-5' RNA ligase